MNQQQSEYEIYQKQYKAMMLSPTLEICIALLRGEDVPMNLLDQEWVQKYGLKN